MPIKNLERIFAPRSVAVFGASQRSASVGGALYRNLTSGQSSIKVYPINPKHKEIAGVQCYATADELPEVVDLAVICTPAATVPGLVKECGERGIRGMVILSAGFRETGAAGRIMEDAVLREAERYSGMRLLGPNCLGFMAPHLGVNASFVDAMPPRGSVAFVSQSGALCSSVLDWAIQENIGFSYFISLGNALDVGFADLIDFLAADLWTDSIVLYVESIAEARQFMSAARAFTRSKPIIAYKAGRFAESAKAAASHTGAMAGVDAVYEAAFARAGIVRVYEIDDLFDCAELLGRQRPPTGPRLAIITNAGGPGVMATDSLMSRQGSLASLTASSMSRLNEFLPEAWSHGNPIDILGDATSERFLNATATALADEGVDGVLVILSPQTMTDPTGSAAAVIQAAKRSSKPVLCSWMGGSKVEGANQLFRNAGIPAYSSPEKAVRAFTYLVEYAKRKERLYETPREMRLPAVMDSPLLRPILGQSGQHGQQILTEDASKELLQGYGIPVTPTKVARNAPDAVAISREAGYPVVLKLYSPDITHKTDVGGVELNIRDDVEVVAAYQHIMERARLKRPDARLEGVTVQPMRDTSKGQELLVGAKRDPVFGMVLLLGAGGTTAEVIKDRSLELPPLSERLARQMVESLRIWPLLQEHRGRPAIKLDRLIEVLMRLSYLVANHPEIVELDVNPLLATPDDVVALDARVVVDHDLLRDRPAAYSHLAIRPYPDEFVSSARTKDNREITLRPIRPEDEPLWHELLRACSAETIHSRFRYLFKTTTHEMAARFCFIDYDRELALVAEREEGGKRQLIGVGRLIANADHTHAEYAILVSDPWQGQGVGSLLTDRCLDICQKWNIHRVVAETATENFRMISMFRRRGFTLSSISSDTMLAVKELRSANP